MEKKEKLGMVLEGGGMRGIYTAGVLDVFMEKGIHVDGVIGVSAGAIHGCSYVSGQAGRSIRYYKKYYMDKRFMSFHNFFRTGDLVDEKFCYHELPEKLDPYDFEAFRQSETEFFVTCTNLETGKAEYIKIHDMKDDVDYMRASASLPYVSRIVEKGGKKLLDGGCSDSIPVQAFRNMGYERNIVVLTRPAGYRKEAKKHGAEGIVYRKYPKFVKALRTRPEVYNRTIDEIEALEKAGKIFVIRPSSPLAIGRMSHDVKEIIAAYEKGRSDVWEQIDKLREWIK